ncbi:putative glycoside hydrolase [Tissierella sp.]|uniref:putative glycoside hydrolase n=1 Tax=Tissierella sp. TaxID=41274 RepID=UPI002863B6A6|nr:putative glycoside hydrolase [Tissierella sp.]MDR7857908.1 putative glycoside hydrolase [Tissierella sp.]
MHNRRIKLGALLISTLILSGCAKIETAISGVDVVKEDAPNIITEVDYLKQPSTNWASYKEMIDVKSIYMTGHTLGWKTRFHKLVQFIDETEINAVVIDVKDDFGEMTYKSSVPMVQEVEADKVIRDKDFVGSMKLLAEKDIYPIARIVSFKDKTAASKRPDLAVKTKDGSVWRDNKGDAWLNPYNRDAWEYLVEIAEEAALKGFKEIQFDYVRFPTDGKRDLIDYGAAGEEPMRDAIAGFLSYARERLAPHGVYVSADIFGLVTTVEDDMRLGQHLETLATAVDILCPMVYPSHYALGTYGVKYPDADPYTIVNTSMKIAKERIDKIETTEKKAILRPWLQDFSAPWLKREYGANYTPYGAEQLRAQKKATYDADLTQWIFWNAGNKYTEEGYER